MDARWVATLAFVTFGVVSLMRSGFTLQVDTRTLMIPTLIQGAAMAMFFIPLTSVILSGQPPEKIPSASGVSNFVRITFGAIGASISTTIWENRTALHHAQLVEQVNPYNPTYIDQLNHLMQMGMSQAQANGQIERSISQQAAMLGANDIFWISGVLFFVLIVFVWLTKPKKEAIWTPPRPGRTSWFGCTRYTRCTARPMPSQASASCFLALPWPRAQAVRISRPMQPHCALAALSTLELDQPLGPQGAFTHARHAKQAARLAAIDTGEFVFRQRHARRQVALRDALALQEARHRGLVERHRYATLQQRIDRRKHCGRSSSERCSICSSVTAPSRLRSPTAVRRRPVRCAPQPSASPMSSARVRM